MSGASPGIDRLNTMVKILIADDHALVRAGYRQFLERDSTENFIGEADSGQETLRRLRLDHWDLLLLDIQMPGGNGIDVLRTVVPQHPDMPVLIISGLPEEQYAPSLIRAGATGFVSKAAPIEVFLQAVHLALAGRRFRSEPLIESLTATAGGATELPPGHAGLTAREFQVLCKLAAGMTVGAVSCDLSLSTKTISTYRSRILEKMKFRSNADMTIYALRAGLLP